MIQLLPLFYAFLGRFISAGGVLALSVILSRQLPMKDTGEFFAAFAALMGLAIILQAGQQILLMRKVANAPDITAKAGELYSRSLATVLLLCIPVIFVLFAYSLISRNFSLPLLWLWLPLLPATLIGQNAAYFKGLDNPGMGGFLEIGLISTIASIIFLIFPPSSSMAAWMWFCAIAWLTFIISSCLMFYYQKFNYKDFRPQMSLLYEGRYLWAVSGLSYIAQWGGVVLAAFLINSESVAALNALFRLLAPLQFVILTMDFYLAPKFAQSNVPQMRQLRLRGIGISMLAVIPYAFLALVFSSEILGFIYGDSYAQYSSDLRILIIGGILTILLGCNGIILNMKSMDSELLFGTILKTVSYFVCTILAYHYLGLLGFSLALAISMVITNLYYRITTYKISDETV